MDHAFLGFLGGVGLFLFGMETMTAALRELGRDRLRLWLARLTTTPLRGMLTGLAATAAVQSSTAVTVMTIGFVGAGVLGFAQSLGILFGANIGTTVTGWIVVLLGFKLDLAQAMLPVLFAASLMMLLSRGRAARLGQMLAGTALLFLGLDMMQQAMAGLDAARWLRHLPDDGLSGWLALAGIGVVLVTVTQSSSAGVAMVLVLVGSGGVTVTQGAALVIGLNVGTTFTALLTAIGGSREVRMTGLANLVFNLVTAAMALPLLGLVAPLLRAADAPTALVLFHSAFNIIGALVFLPLTRPFAALIGWLVPDRSPALAQALDRRLLSDPAAALDAAESVARKAAALQARALSDALSPRSDLRPLAASAGQVRQTLEALGRWLAQIRVGPDQAGLQARYAQLLHRMDHLARLQDRLADHASLHAIGAHPALRRPARALAAGALAESGSVRMTRLTARAQARARDHRARILAGPLDDPAQALRASDAARWLDRVAAHLEALARHRPPAP